MSVSFNLPGGGSPQLAARRLHSRPSHIKGGRLYRIRAGIAGCLLLALSMSALSGCAGKPEEETEDRYTIGVVTKSRNSEYWMSVCAGMENAAKADHAQVVILSPDSETNEVVQKKMIRDLLKRGVDALAVSPINSYDNRDYIKEADKKGIPVFAYDTPIVDAQVPYIGIDNEKTGYEVAEKLAEKMGHKGRIAVIAGSELQASHRERVLGFEHYMSLEPDIKIEVVKSGYSNLRVSEKEMEEIRKDYPGLDGIMTTSAVTALGIAEATAGTGIAIATIDDQEDAIRAVEKGRIAVLAAQSGYEVGRDAIRYIIRDLEGVKQKPEEILHVQILTQENVEEYQNLKK